MRFTVHTKLNKAALRAIDVILVTALLPKDPASKKGPDFDETFDSLDRIDQLFIKNYIKAKQPKAGDSRLLVVNKGPNVFLAVDTEFTEKKIAMLVRKLVRTAKGEGMKQIGIYIDDFEKSNIFAERAAHLVVENALLAHYDFSEQFKTAPKEGWKSVGGIAIFTLHDEKLVQMQIAQAELIAESVNHCRALANMPPSDLKPEGMAEAARTAAKSVGKSLTVTVFDEKKLKAEGMNSILAVGSGSSSAPRLIIMEYKGGKPKDQTIAFVGKGVTFDSGGLNLKPGEHMADMHMDMSGGAAVIYAMYAIAKMKLPINAMGFVPAVENMPSGFSYRQGDIVKAYGGKTMEIGNTDAEGRVILADAIEYAKTKKPGLVITIATLTGAAMVALGTRLAGLLVKDNKPLRDKLEEIGGTSGDVVWPLPLTEDHEKEVEGNFADVINTSKTNSRYGGASTAAAFLSHYAKGVNFAHIDMAPRMTANPDEELSRGAIGFGVRYFIELAKQWSEVQKLLKTDVGSGK